jgi:hypothetical protein
LGVGSCLLAAALGAAACGKKGPPLAPIVRIPASIDQISARRVGSDVYVTVTVPQQNIDASMPADVERIDVFGYTGRQPPPRALFADLGTRIGSVPVVPVPRPGDPPAPLPDPDAGAVQGMSATVVDTLEADELVQGRVAPPLAGRRPPIAPLSPVSEAAMPLRRFYLAVPWGPRGRPGPPGAEAELPLTGLPDAPNGVVVGYTVETVRVDWEPSGGLIGFLLDREIPVEPAPFDDPVPVAGAVTGTTIATAAAGTTTATAAAATGALAGPTRYNVYRLIEPDPLADPLLVPNVAAWRVVAPVPANPEPLSVLTFSDPVLFERMRCYRVRAVRGVAPTTTESEATAPVCIRPVDVFPPAPPAPPALVAGEGAISLIWEPNGEADLGGYLVLRGEPGDATLPPLTPAPILETSFRDDTVMPGKRYVYAIVAVDDRLPLGNASAPSERVEETAR